MARDLPKMPETESERVNVKAITDALKDGFSNLYDLDSQIDALMDRHIRPLREKKADIMRVLREGYHLPARLVRSRYTGYVVERDAEKAGDSSTLDTIRLLYETIPVHGIIDMFDPKGARFEEDKRPTASQKNLAKARAAGRKMSMSNGNMTDCPHAGLGKDSKKLRDAWLKGYQAHQKELAKKLKKEGKASPAAPEADTTAPAPISNTPPAPAAPEPA